MSSEFIWRKEEYGVTRLYHSRHPTVPVARMTLCRGELNVYLVGPAALGSEQEMFFCEHDVYDKWMTNFENMWRAVVSSTERYVKARLEAIKW